MRFSVVLRPIMWLVCHSLYWMGHYWSSGILRFDCMGWTYPVYNNLMYWSCSINDKYNFKLWSK